MTNKKRILVVDDSSNEVRILMELLKQDYAVVAATSGEKAIELVSGDNAPDLVLMDVTMEPMDGYQACKAIHQLNEKIPVIFVSANTQTDEILKGFDAGGIDYITKPIDEQILLSKVGLVLRLDSKRQDLESEKKQASELINVALASAGKLSVLFNFLRSGLKLKSQQELSDQILKTCREFGLEGSVQVRNDEVINGSTQGVVNPLEEELLIRSKEMEERILETGPRMIICFESISMLLKNIPIDDEVAHGEIRDNLMFIAEDAHNLNLKIGQEQNLHDKRESIVSKALKDSQTALHEFESYQTEHKERSIKIMDELLSEMDRSYFNMGLTDEQEESISNIISTKVQESLEHMEGGLRVDEQIKSIAASLGEIAKSL
jgi:CheY-like chemotaxis protein